MNLNFNHIQHDDNLQKLSATARHLMSANRQRVQHRSQAMLNRAVAELKIDA